MAWYAAHMVQRVRFRDGVQDYWPFYENIVLIEAASPDEAWEKAEQIGQEHEVDDLSFTCNERPAQMVFAGVRKVVALQSLTGDEHDPPQHGTEITYGFFRTDDAEEFADYMNNIPAIMLVEE